MAFRKLKIEFERFSGSLTSNSANILCFYMHKYMLKLNVLSILKNYSLSIPELNSIDALNSVETPAVPTPGIPASNDVPTVTEAPAVRVNDIVSETLTSCENGTDKSLLPPFITSFSLNILLYL